MTLTSAHSLCHQVGDRLAAVFAGGIGDDQDLVVVDRRVVGRVVDVEVVLVVGDDRRRPPLVYEPRSKVPCLAGL